MYECAGASGDPSVVPGADPMYVIPGIASSPIV